MEEHGIEQDLRARRPLVKLICFMSPARIRELVAEESACIFDFDGSSIEAPTQAG